MLKWLLVTILLSLGFTIALFYIPVILTGKPIASTVLTFGSVFGFYLGIVISNIRFHQFDMEHWWLKAWQWLVFILIALIADTLFFYFLHLTHTTSIGLAISAGSIYLIIRQWFWGRFSGNGSRALDRALPHLLDALARQQQRLSLDQQWRHLIERVFNPLNVKAISDKCDTVNIRQRGMALQLPSLDGLATLEAFCCDQGKRLLSPPM